MNSVVGRRPLPETGTPSAALRASFRPFICVTLQPGHLEGRLSSAALPSGLPSTAGRMARQASNGIQILGASAGFEPAVEGLQTSALPLGELATGPANRRA